MAEPVGAAAAHLNRPGLVVVAGPPGCGRSTRLRELTAAVPGPVHAGGGLAMLSGVPALALSRAVRARLPAHDVHLLAEAVRSRVRGGLLVLDDLQYADPATLAALPLIAAHCRVLAALRTPHRVDEAPLRAAATAWLDVPPLAAAAADDLARRHAPHLDPAARAAVVARAGGNPLAITALARHAGAGRAPAAGGLDQVAYALATALADLHRPARTALAALGLLGRPAPAALLGAGAADLLAAGLVTDTGGGLLPVSTYLAETAAGLLDPAARTDLHRRLADLTPPAEACRHLAAAGDPAGAYRQALTAADRATGEERAALLLFACRTGVPVDPRVRIAAADALLAAGRPATAARVLSGTGPLGVEADILRGEALLQAGDPVAARQAVRPVPDAAPPPVVAARDRVLLLADLAADPATAADTADKIAARHPVPPAGLAAALAAVRAVRRADGWDVGLARAAGLDPALLLPPPPGTGSGETGHPAPGTDAGPPRWEPDHTGSPDGGTDHAGPPDRGTHHAGPPDRGAAKAESPDAGPSGPASDPLTSRWTAWLLVESLAADGRLAESAAVARKAAAGCGAALAYGWQTRFLAAADWATALHGTLAPAGEASGGNDRQTAPSVRPETAGADHTGPAAGARQGAADLAGPGTAAEARREVAAEARREVADLAGRGIVAEAGPAVAAGGADDVQRRAADLVDRSLPVEARAYATAAAALVEADTGLLAAARARLDAGPDHPATAWVAREATWLDGQPGQARSAPAPDGPGLLTGLHHITARWAAHDAGVPEAAAIPDGLPAAARRTLLAWATGSGFDGAADAWRPSAVRERVRCLLAAGLLTTDGQRAVAALLAAEQLADAAGLTVLAGRARRGLRRHRIHRDTRSRRSGDQLTRRERDVLRLVAAGEPTRRIAGQLGISAETVDTHIRAGMRKLGARTRTEAAALAFAAGEDDR